MPSPTPSETHPFSFTHGGPIDGITDDLTLVGAATAGYESGATDNYGRTPSPGNTFFWLSAIEINGGASPYASSHADFDLQGSDGSVYKPDFGYPPDKTGAQIMSAAIIGYNANNQGWIEYQVPAVRAVYTVRWNEGDAVSPVGMATVQVDPGG